MPVFYGKSGDDFISLLTKHDDYTIYGDALPDYSENPGNNIIYAGRGNDTIYAGYGSDFVSGGAGNDIIYGYGLGGPTRGSAAYAEQDGADRLYGGGGDDILYGGGGNDIIAGGAGNDILQGGSGNDALSGGDGDDILASGTGSDVLRGGAGRDTFLYAYSPLGTDGSDANGGRDVILDFESGTDRIDISGYIVSEAELTVTQTARGLLLQFPAVYETGEIELRGVWALQPGDVVFA